MHASHDYLFKEDITTTLDPKTATFYFFQTQTIAVKHGTAFAT